MLFCSCLFGRMYLCVLPSSFTSKLCTGSIYVTESWFSAKSLPNSRAQRDELKATYEAKPWNSPDGIQRTDWRPDHSNNRKPNVFHFPRPRIQWPISLSRLDQLVFCPWSPIACKRSKLLANPAHMVHSCWPSKPYTCIQFERKHKHFLRAKINSTNFGTKQTIATGIFEPAGDTIFIPQGTLFFWYIPITTHDCLRSNLLFNLFVCLKTHRNHSGEADSCCLLNLGQWNIDHRKQLKNVHKSICKTKVICVQPSFESKRFTPKHTCINTQTTVFKCVTSKICKGMLPKIYLYWSSD